MYTDKPGYRLYVEFCDDELRRPRLYDEEHLIFSLEHIGIAFRDTDNAIDTVTLFVTSHRIIMVGGRITVDFDVPYITLHAVTRDPASYRLPCLYCQLDYEDDSDDENNEDDNGGDDENVVDNPDNDEGDDSRTDNGACRELEGKSFTDAICESPLLSPGGELFLIPNEESQLMAIFDAFSQAALLNPGSDRDDDDDDDQGLIFNLDEVIAGSSQAQTLAHLESIFIVPSDAQRSTDGVFDDAV